MPAISTSLIQSRAELHMLARRNFASKNPGVILVFCIVGAVAILLLGLFIHKKLAARRSAKGMQ
jgi:hypothetical protein